MSVPLSLTEFRDIDPIAADAMAKLSNLEAVLRWSTSLAGIDSVQQDEYNYDILLPLESGRWAVFGVS